MSDGPDDELYMTPDRIKETLASSIPSVEVDNVLNGPRVNTIWKSIACSNDNADAFLQDLYRHVCLYLLHKRRDHDQLNSEEEKGRLENIAESGRQIIAEFGNLGDKGHAMLLGVIAEQKALEDAEAHDPDESFDAAERLCLFQKEADAWCRQLIDICERARRTPMKQGNPGSRKEKLFLARVACCCRDWRVMDLDTTRGSDFYQLAKYILNAAGYPVDYPDDVVKAAVSWAMGTPPS